MAEVQTVKGKIGNMRKEQEFVVYTNFVEVQGIRSLCVQSDTVYARLNLGTGEGVYANRPNGATSASLVLHGKPCTVPMALMLQFIEAMPKDGDTMSGVCSIVVPKENH